MPPEIKPPKVPTERRHKPEPSRSWRAYRACLRWDFGFVCPFCLVHESDLVEHGVEGTGLSWVEHIITRSADSSRKGDYDNCVYSCRYCNNRRLNRPRVDGKGRELLDPTTVAWGDHFILRNDQLVAANRDASYTEETYDLNDRRKVQMREARRLVISDRLRILREVPSLIERLMTRLADDPGQDDEQLVAVARELRRTATSACRDLERYLAVPEDCPRECRCGRTQNHSLPGWLHEQVIDVDTRAWLERP